MVNEKKIKTKLPSLITDGPWYSNEYDVKAYRLRQYSRKNPSGFQQDFNNLVVALQRLDVNAKSVVNGKK